MEKQDREKDIQDDQSVDRKDLKSSERNRGSSLQWDRLESPLLRTRMARASCFPLTPQNSSANLVESLPDVGSLLAKSRRKESAPAELSGLVKSELSQRGAALHEIASLERKSSRADDIYEPLGEESPSCPELLEELAERVEGKRKRLDEIISRGEEWEEEWEEKEEEVSDAPPSKNLILEMDVGSFDPMVDVIPPDLRSCTEVHISGQKISVYLKGSSEVEVRKSSKRDDRRWLKRRIKEAKNKAKGIGVDTGTATDTDSSEENSCRTEEDFHAEDLPITHPSQMPAANVLFSEVRSDCIQQKSKLNADIKDLLLHNQKESENSALLREAVNLLAKKIVEKALERFDETAMASDWKALVSSGAEQLKSSSLSSYGESERRRETGREDDNIVDASKKALTKKDQSNISEFCSAIAVQQRHSEHRNAAVNSTRSSQLATVISGDIASDGLPKVSTSIDHCTPVAAEDYCPQTPESIRGNSQNNRHERDEEEKSGVDDERRENYKTNSSVPQRNDEVEFIPYLASNDASSNMPKNRCNNNDYFSSGSHSGKETCETREEEVVVVEAVTEENIQSEMEKYCQQLKDVDDEKNKAALDSTKVEEISPSMKIVPEVELDEAVAKSIYEQNKEYRTKGGLEKCARSRSVDIEGQKTGTAKDRRCSSALTPHSIQVTGPEDELRSEDSEASGGIHTESDGDSDDQEEPANDLLHVVLGIRRPSLMDTVEELEVCCRMAAESLITTTKTASEHSKASNDETDSLRVEDDDSCSQTGEADDMQPAVEFSSGGTRLLAQNNVVSEYIRRKSMVELDAESAGLYYSKQLVNQKIGRGTYRSMDAGCLETDFMDSVEGIHHHRPVMAEARHPSESLSILEEFDPISNSSSRNKEMNSNPNCLRLETLDLKGLVEEKKLNSGDQLLHQEEEVKVTSSDSISKHLAGHSNSALKNAIKETEQKDGLTDLAKSIVEDAVDEAVKLYQTNRHQLHIGNETGFNGKEVDVSETRTQSGMEKNRRSQPPELPALNQRCGVPQWEGKWSPEVPGMVADEQCRIDTKAIEPYKQVLTHGGYYNTERNVIVVLSSSFLPDVRLHDYNYIMDNLFLFVISTMNHLITGDYYLVYFHGSLSRSKTPSIRWIKKCYDALDRKLKKNLQKLFVVHPTIWLKSLFLISKTFVSKKSSKKVKYVNSLQELTELIPTEYIILPEEIKAVDKKGNPRTEFQTNKFRNQ